MFDFPEPQFFHLPNGTTTEQGEMVVHRKAAGADSFHYCSALQSLDPASPGFLVSSGPLWCL